MNLYKRLFCILVFSIILNNSADADLPHYLDFKYILNESNAGKKAQTELKKKLESGLKSINQREKKVQEEEKKIIEQKKLISPEEYKKKVTELRSKVSKLRQDRNNLIETIAKQRSKARSELLKNLNPIIKDYMQEKGIRFVVDKKSLIMADEKLNITEEIIKLLNNKLKSIKLN